MEDFANDDEYYDYLEFIEDKSKYLLIFLST